MERDRPPAVLRGRARHAALSYVAFDLLWLDRGADLHSLPLSERRRRLERILAKG
jgi:ATP-dependent DNA ligase